VARAATAKEQEKERMNLVKRSLRTALVGVPLLLGGASAASALGASADAAYDRWMYPFNSTPGARTTAPTFGSLDPGPFDNRDGQLHVGFDTASAGVTPGLGPERYEITSVRVTVTHFQGSFVYDGSYDSYQTYDGTLADADAGRPIELHGLGFRSGFSSLELSPGVPGPPGFEETDAYAFGDPTAEGVRNAYPIAPDGADVSNNVDGGFESEPWAVGQAMGLSPGDDVVEGVAGVSAGTTFAFELDLGDPAVLAYLRQGLDAGLLGFAITSLHATSEEGGTNPVFYTRDDFDPAAIPPTLEIDYTLPEPSPSLLGGGSLLTLVLLRRRRRGSVDWRRTRLPATRGTTAGPPG
jgi:hypothetical protein